MTGLWRGMAVVGALGLAVCAGASRARAQDEPSGEAAERADLSARIHFQAANEYFEVADFEAALREFERAYGLSHRPELLYNLYLCHERLGHLEQASEYLGRFLIEAHDVPERTTLEARLRTMRRRLEEQHAEEQAARERAAQEQAAQEQAAQERDVHRASEEEDQAASTASSTAATGPTGGREPTDTAAPGRESPLAGGTGSTTPPSAVAGIPDEVPNASRGHSTAALVLGATAVAAMISFGVSAGLAKSANDEASALCGAAVGRQCVGDEPVLGRLRRRTTAADLSLGVAGASAVAALIAAVVHRNRRATPVATSDGHGFGLGLVGRF